METKKLTRGIGAFVSSILVVGLGAMPALADGIYNDIPAADVNGGPETTSYASLANGAFAFGSVIDPTSTGWVNNATLMMSNYATASQYGAAPNSSYNATINLQLYQVTGPGNLAPAPDTIYAGADVALMDSQTQTFSINYRPEADINAIPGGCGVGNSDAYLVSANVYSCGQLAALSFTNLNDLLVNGTSYIWVASILGGDPATQSLNWAINNLTDVNSISPASNPQYDTNYVNNVGGTGWGSIGQGEIAFAPEPATLGLIGLGLVGIGMSVRKKSRKN